MKCLRVLQNRQNLKCSLFPSINKSIQFRTNLILQCRLFCLEIEKNENIHKFLSALKNKYNLQTQEDWNSLSKSKFQSNGGRELLKKYTIYELKCIACPEGKSLFKKPPKKSGFWKIEDNILDFLNDLKKKYKFDTPEDWNLITKKMIQSNGGNRLLKNYSIYELKCLACPEGKSKFKTQNKPSEFWENKENILNFLCEIKEKYNLQTPEDWNSITHKHIQSKGGWALLKKHSIYELKCMACPDGKLLFNPKQVKGYWNKKENILKFLSKIKEKYNLQSPEEWNSITASMIESNGGRRLLKQFSVYEVKCMACPEGKSLYNNPPIPSTYWENKENILKFLSELQIAYNLQSSEDWNSITHKHIQLKGGWALLKKHSIYELKCMACPDGKVIFTKQPKPKGFWEDETNRNNFISELKHKYNLRAPSDWKRVSQSQIISHGGNWIFDSKNDHLEVKVQFEDSNSEKKSIPLKELISYSISKRSSQRWLFLQIQKLFPNEEIIEDYFHSELSRKSGANIQFDIFMIERNIAIEYHGKHHYEDIPSGFAPLELHQNRDLEKQKLCSEHGIKLIVIPYWWDNRLDSLRTTLYSEVNK